MSLLGASGTYVCDRCGASVDNASIALCAVVTDLDPDRDGMIRNLHFCRVNDCVSKVLSSRNLENYKARRQQAEQEIGEADKLKAEIARLNQLVAQLKED